MATLSAKGLSSVKSRKTQVCGQDTKTQQWKSGDAPGTLMIALIASMKTRFLLREKLVITRRLQGQNFAVWVA